MGVLLISGLGILAGGLLTLVYGIPIKDFSFGNTLIIAGTITACTGALMIGLALVSREVRQMSHGLADALARLPAADRPLSRSAAAEPRIGEPAPTALEGVERDEERREPSVDLSPSRMVPEPPPSPPVEAAAKQRRNLLFVSSSRKEREKERAAPRPEFGHAPPNAYSELSPPVAHSDEPRFDMAPPSQDQPDSSNGSSRSAPIPPRLRSEAARPTDPSPAPPAPPEPTPTVVKSGSVDGMAYSLYSDGSIEAEMPEGMMRFSSIAELRAHLDHQ